MRKITRIRRAVQPIKVAIIEKIAASMSKKRKVFNGTMNFKKTNPTSTIAGIENKMIGFHAMVESGNRKGREAIKIVVSRITAREAYATNLYTFISSSIFN
jgi:hypothetical protein